MEREEKGETKGRREEEIKEKWEKDRGRGRDGNRDRENVFAQCSEDPIQKQVLLGYSGSFLVDDVTAQ